MLGLKLQDGNVKLILQDEWQILMGFRVGRRSTWTWQVGNHGFFLLAQRKQQIARSKQVLKEPYTAPFSLLHTR